MSVTFPDMLMRERAQANWFKPRAAAWFWRVPFVGLVSVLKLTENFASRIPGYNLAYQFGFPPKLETNEFGQRVIKSQTYIQICRNYRGFYWLHKYTITVDRER